jgi:hypothetical protein
MWRYEVETKATFFFAKFEVFAAVTVKSRIRTVVCLTAPRSLVKV